MSANDPRIKQIDFITTANYLQGVEVIRGEMKSYIQERVEKMCLENQNNENSEKKMFYYSLNVE